MARGTCRPPSRLAKKIRTLLQVLQATDPKLTGHTHTVPTIGGAVPVGCMLHAPQADNVFDVGSSAVRKL